MKRKRHYNIHGRGGKADFEAQYKMPGRLRPANNGTQYTVTDNIFTVFAFLAGLFILKQIIAILWQT